MKKSIVLICLGLFTASAFAFDAKDIKRDWLYGSDDDREGYETVLNKPIPSDFKLGTPINAGEISAKSIAGKYTVVDIWATWCGPCIRSIPLNNQVYTKYKGKINFIGVCAERGGNKLAAMVKSKSIAYPVGIDVGDKLTKAMKSTGYPTYHLVDPNGIMVVADIDRGNLDKVLDLVLKSTEAKKNEAKEDTE